MNTKKHSSLRLTEFPWHYISTVCDLLLLFFLVFPLSLVTSHFQYGLFFSPLSPSHFFFMFSLSLLLPEERVAAACTAGSDTHTLLFAADCTLTFAPLNPTVVRWPRTDAVDLYIISWEWTAFICGSNLEVSGISCYLLLARSCCFHYTSHFGSWTAVQLPELGLCLSSGLMLNSLGAWPFWQAVKCQVCLVFSGPASFHRTAPCLLIVRLSGRLCSHQEASALTFYNQIIPMKIFGLKITLACLCPSTE